MANNKVITRICGGLGNQLFCYAAARRFALLNNAELVIDDVSGFVRDHTYQRYYQLDRFSITTRKATFTERLEPFSRIRRYLKRAWNRRRPFEERTYVAREGMDFDRRLLDLKIKSTVYLDGIWQSEGYFKDVENVIRNDLQIITPSDEMNRRVAEQILGKKNSVALHVRWFDDSDTNSQNNISSDYYRNAIAAIEEKITSPHYFIFSDNPAAALRKIALAKENVTCVTHNKGDENSYADLWLMTQCRHFIIANSTFSWWGAWLGRAEDKIVICPKDKVRGITRWGFYGLLPDEWIKVHGRRTVEGTSLIDKYGGHSN